MFYFLRVYLFIIVLCFLKHIKSNFLCFYLLKTIIFNVRTHDVANTNRQSATKYLIRSVLISRKTYLLQMIKHISKKSIQTTNNIENLFMFNNLLS